MMMMKRGTQFYQFLLFLLSVAVVVSGAETKTDPKDLKNLKSGDRRSGSVFGNDKLTFRLIAGDAKSNATKFSFTTDKSGNHGARLTLRKNGADILQIPSQYPLIAKNDIGNDVLIFDGTICPMEARREDYDVDISMSHDIVGADVSPYILNVTEYNADLTDTTPDHGTPGKLFGNGVDYYFINVPQKVVNDDKQISVFVKRLNPADTPSQSPQFFAVNLPEQQGCPNLRILPQCSVSYEAALGAPYPGEFYFDATLKVTTNIPIRGGWKISWIQTDPHEKFAGCLTCDGNSIRPGQAGRISSLFSTEAYQGSFSTKEVRKFGLRFSNTNFKGKHIAPKKWTLNGFPCSINSTQVCSRNANYNALECDQDLSDDEKNGLEMVVKADSNTVRRTIEAFGLRDYYRLGEEKPLQGTTIRVLQEKASEIQSIFESRLISFERNLDKVVTFGQNDSTPAFVQRLGNDPMKIILKQPGRYYVAVRGPPAGFNSMDYRIAYCIGEECDALSQYDDRSNYNPDEQMIDKDKYCSEHPEEYICQQGEATNDVSAAPKRIGALSATVAISLSLLAYMFA